MFTFQQRLHILYKRLEKVVTSTHRNISRTERAKYAVAADICIDVLKRESEGIKVVKELVAKNVQGENILYNLCSQSKNGYDDKSKI